MSEPGGRDELGARPCRGDRRAVGPRDVGVVPVVKDEKGSRHRPRGGEDVEVLPLLAEAAFDRPPHPGEDGRGETDRRSKSLAVAGRVGRRRQEDRPARPEAPLDREGGRRAAHRVRDDRFDSADVAGHGLDRRDELRERRQASGRGAVSRSVERDDGEPGVGERRDEGSQARTAAAPAVDEQDGRPFAPAPDRERPSVEREIGPLALVECFALAFRSLVAGRPAKERNRELRRSDRGDRAQPPEERAKKP
jgi:hypothetical protein